MCLAKMLAAAAFSLSLATPAFASNADNYVLTQPVYNKFVKVHEEFEKMPDQKQKLDKEKDNDEDAESVEDIVKTIESEPKAKAVLARHGISPKEYALTLLAAFAAGFHVAMEPQMDKKGLATLMAGYTKAQQQNVVFMRGQKK